MQLFLRLDGNQGVQDNVADGDALDTVARAGTGDVSEQRREEGYFCKFVECGGLESKRSGICKSAREWAVGPILIGRGQSFDSDPTEFRKSDLCLQGSMSLLLDSVESLRAILDIRESVCQGKLEWYLFRAATKASTWPNCRRCIRRSIRRTGGI